MPPTEFAQCITGLIQNSLKNDSDWLTTQSLEILCTRLRRNDDFDSDYLLAKSVLDQLSQSFKCFLGRNFGQKKSKFSSKIEILAVNKYSDNKLKFWRKIEILAKYRNFGRQFFAITQNSDNKLKFW